MKKLFTLLFLLFAAIALCAMDPTLLMRTCTDPSRMVHAQIRPQLHVGTAFLASGETCFTHVTWLRRRETAMKTVWHHCFQAFFSVVPARATREGGAGLPPVRDVADTPSTSGGTFADPGYDSHGLGTWDFGCYAVNVETPVPLTLVIAGTERQIAASNGVTQAFNVLGSAADYSWSLSGASPATVRFGFAVNQLVEFFGATTQPKFMVDVFGNEEKPVGGVIVGMTNEWTMAVSRARIDGSNVVSCVDALTWGGESFHEDELSSPSPAPAFARDARVAFCIFAPQGNIGPDGTPCLWEEYGTKLFAGRWLTDDEVRNVRDLDMFEMRRRGYTRWASEEIAKEGN